jgi:glutathione S-transferase
VAQSKKAKEHHPFGFIPSLLHGQVELRESQAIARYIERVFPEPSLELGHGSHIVPEKVWEFVSIVASFGFSAVELGYVKPIVKTPERPEGVDIEKLDNFLRIVIELMQPSLEGRFVFGNRLTWADIFLYPLIADLDAVLNDKYPVKHELLHDKRLEDWRTAMKELKAVEKTFEGTLEAGGSL